MSREELTPFEKILYDDDHTSTPKVYKAGCYICDDPDFAQMGLPLCRTCPECQKEGRGKGHIPADDSVCTECGYDEMEEHGSPIGYYLDMDVEIMGDYGDGWVGAIFLGDKKKKVWRMWGDQIKATPWDEPPKANDPH